MKKVLIVFSMVSLMFASSITYAAEPVNVEQYMNIVRAQNHTLLSAVRVVDATYFQVLSSVANQRIKANVSTVGSYYTATGSDMTGKAHNPLGYNISPSLSQVIDISGVMRLNERSSILSYEISRASLDNTLNTLLSSAEQAYWAVVLERENLSLQKDILRQRQENLRVTEEKFNQQLVPKLDVIRATTMVSDAENKIVDAEGKLSNGLAALRNFAGGLDVEPASSDFAVPMLKLDSEPTYAVALEKHPNVRQRKIQLAQSELQRQISAKGMAPSLTATAAWDMFSGVSTGSSFETGEANVRLSLNIPLSDGNFTKYDTINKAITIESTRETLFASEAEVILNLSLALNNWNTAKSLEENMKQQVVRSNEELKITELMYNEGMGSQLDLITAQTDNQTVRTNYLQAILGMYTAITDLRKALGDYATNEDGSWKMAVIKYGKEAPDFTKPANVSLISKPVKPANDQVIINIRGVDVTVDQAMDWLATGKMPSGIEKTEGIDMPLYKKNLGTNKNERYYPSTNNDEITLDEAKEWLEKNR